MKKIIYLSIFLPLFFTSGCRRLAQNNELQSAQDHAQMESEYAQIYDAVSDFAGHNSKTGKTESVDDYVLPNGATVTFQDTVFDSNGVSFTIDYGPLGTGNNKGIPCKDGRYRAGKIKVALDQHWNVFPSQLTITIDPDQYYTGNGTTMNQVSGTKVIRHNSQYDYDITVSNAVMKKQGGTVSWSAQRHVTQVVDVPGSIWGDEYLEYGTANGTNIKGENFSITTVAPLRKKIEAGCLTTFVAGELRLQTDTKVLMLNYDAYNNQACDKKALVTLNGKSHIIDVW
ncbi:MAG: hypothetical protein U0T73_00960 [Chitinophagales bacterium]